MDFSPVQSAYVLQQSHKGDTAIDDRLLVNGTSIACRIFHIRHGE
jgi:hypothetical protein